MHAPNIAALFSNAIELLCDVCTRMFSVVVAVPHFSTGRVRREIRKQDLLFSVTTPWLGIARSLPLFYDMIPVTEYPCLVSFTNIILSYDSFSCVPASLFHLFSYIFLLQTVEAQSET